MMLCNRISACAAGINCLHTCFVLLDGEKDATPAPSVDLHSADSELLLVHGNGDSIS